MSTDLLTPAMLRAYREDLEAGTVPDVAKSKVHSRLLREYSVEDVARARDDIGRKLQQVERRVLGVRA